MNRYILIAIIAATFGVGILAGAYGGNVIQMNHMQTMMSGMGGMSGMSGMGGMSGMSGMGGMSGMSGMGGMSGMSGMGGMSGMSGMGGMSGMSGMGGMSGMSGMGGMSSPGGGQSRHGQFYAPGTIHQLCHQDSMMAPAYCEPHYQTMSSVPGVKITHVHPVDNTTLEVTLTEISSAKNGIDQSTTIFVGNNYLYGSTDIPSGWKDKTTVTVKLTGMGIVYDYESMHAHLGVSANPTVHSEHQ